MSKKLSKKHRKAAGLSESIPSPKRAASVTAMGNSPMTSWLILLVLILPFLFSRVTIDPVMTIRYIFLSVFLLLFVVYFFIIKKSGASFSFPPIVRNVFLLSLAFGIWTVFTLSVAINLGEGYFQVFRHFLLLLLLLVVTVTFSKEGSKPLALCKAFIILSILQSIVGICQYYDIEFTDIPGANAMPYGLMANRNLFGSAQMLMLPFILYALYKSSRPWKYAASLALIITIISLILSQTRSAWLASAAIIIISLALVAVFSPTNRKKWIIGSSIGSAVIVLLVFLVISTDNEGSLSKSIKERAGSIAFTTADTSGAASNANERMKIWKVSMAMIKDHPLTGVGAGNWKIAIAPYGGNDLVWAYGQYIPDRPHNIYLQVLSETGIPGAVLYFGVWLLVLFIGFKMIIKPKSEDERVLIILMLAGLAGFAIDGFFSFPAERFEHSLYMMVMAGIILGSYCASKNGTAKTFTINRGIALLFSVIAVFNLYLAFQRHNFEVHMNRAKAYDKKNNFQQVLDETEAGSSLLVTLDPDSKPMEMYRALAYDGLKDYPKAIEEMTKAKKYNPNNAFIYNNMGTIYTDMKNYDSAIVNYQRAIKLTPKFDIAYKNLAVNYFAAGNYAACIETIGKMNIQGDPFFNNMLNEAKRLLEAKKQAP